jgi:germination protein M
MSRTGRLLAILLVVFFAVGCGRTELPGTRMALYFVKSTATSFYLSIEYRMIAAGNSPEEAAGNLMRALIAGPQTQGLTRVLPADTRVISVKIEKGLATMDLSKEATRLNAGSSLESLAITAIANTLTKLPDVDRVQLLVEGKVAESLAGHVDIRKPFRRDDTVVQY